MPLASGARIGGYEITALIGAGGMGEVYRARDPRLGRDVAIKIVSPAIAADAEGVMRFEREARLLASLNHPNIAAIYGVDDSAGYPALILELVEGETLADRIARGRVPVDEALRYAIQIADALDAAHEAGIVHRDLKPGNVKISGHGIVKVLDFGLAKAIAAASAPEPVVDPAASPTVTVHDTRRGVILGTAAYMSPEQARGKTIDKRTDIWAFGCVLYEMLAGRRVYDGETTSDVIAAILERQPDMTTLPASLPAHVRRVIERCLEKDPKRRARDIFDVRTELDEPRSPDAKTQRPVVAAVLVAAFVTAAIVGMPVWRGIRTAPPASLAFSLLPETGTDLNTGNLGIAIAPDGQAIAFSARSVDGTTGIWVRTLDATSAVELKGTSGAEGAPFWSPDSRHIGFFAGGYLRRIPRGGGPVTVIARMATFAGATWNRDDVIVVGPANRSSLYRVQASGGTLEPITTLDQQRENSHRWPQFLPDDDHFLFTARSNVRDNNLIYVGSLRGMSIRPLRPAQSGAAYVPQGYILFAERGTLMAQRFDMSALSLAGEPVPLVSSVRHSPPSSLADYSVSADGAVLAYLTSEPLQSHLMWFDRSGKHLGNVGPPAAYAEAKLSPTARTVLVDIPDPDSGTRELWLVDVITGTATRLTSNPATDWLAAWARDGARIAFASDRGGVSSVFLKRMDGSDDERLIYRGKYGAFPTDWSPDGRVVLAHIDSSAPNGEILAVPTDDGGGEARVVLEGKGFAIQEARFSPDGRWLAYESLETGEREIYISPYNRPGRIRVSTNGGHNARWRADGRELFFESRAGELMAAAIAPEEPLTVTPPVKLFSFCESTTPPTTFVGNSSFSTVANGSRFLARCRARTPQATRVEVLMNWAARLQER